MQTQAPGSPPAGFVCTLGCVLRQAELLFLCVSVASAVSMFCCALQLLFLTFFIQQYALQICPHSLLQCVLRGFRQVHKFHVLHLSVITGAPGQTHGDRHPPAPSCRQRGASLGSPLRAQASPCMCRKKGGCRGESHAGWVGRALPGMH